MRKTISSFILLLTPFLLTAQQLPQWTTRPAAEQIIKHDGFTVSYNNLTQK